MAQTTEETIDPEEVARLKEIERKEKIEKNRQLKAYGKYNKAINRLEKGSNVYKNKIRKKTRRNDGYF